jgi:Tfp pilus assembly protein PilF
MPSSPDTRAALARELLDRGAQLQRQGEVELAAGLYSKSIDLYPSAEAHTMLGWARSLQGRLQEAIEECRKAIALDPDFGNPYNDIGAYLLELGKPEDAIGWLEQATSCPRYQFRHYPWYNLGRAYLAVELYSKARECFAHALDIEADYQPAAAALGRLSLLIQ